MNTDLDPIEIKSYRSVIENGEPFYKNRPQCPYCKANDDTHPGWSGAQPKVICRNCRAYHESLANIEFMNIGSKV